MALNFNGLEFEGVPTEDEEEALVDDVNSESSLLDEEVDYDSVYALFDFLAMVEGQVTVNHGEKLTLLDDSNSYWWLVQVLRNNQIGYIPADNVETPYEKLARINRHKNMKLTQVDPEHLLNRSNTNNSKEKNGYTNKSKRGVTFHSDLITEEFETYYMEDSDSEYELYDDVDEDEEEDEDEEARDDSDDEYYHNGEYMEDDESGEHVSMEEEGDENSVDKDEQEEGDEGWGGEGGRGRARRRRGREGEGRINIKEDEQEQLKGYTVIVGFADDNNNDTPKHTEMRIMKEWKFSRVIEQGIDELQLEKSNDELQYQLYLYVAKKDHIQLISGEDTVEERLRTLVKQLGEEDLIPAGGKVSADVLQLLLRQTDTDTILDDIVEDELLEDRREDVIGQKSEPKEVTRAEDVGERKSSEENESELEINKKEYIPPAKSSPQLQLQKSQRANGTPEQSDEKGHATVRQIEQMVNEPDSLVDRKIKISNRNSTSPIILSPRPRQQQQHQLQERQLSMESRTNGVSTRTSIENVYHNRQQYSQQAPQAQKTAVRNRISIQVAPTNYASNNNYSKGEHEYDHENGIGGPRSAIGVVQMGRSSSSTFTDEFPQSSHKNYSELPLDSWLTMLRGWLDSDSSVQVEQSYYSLAKEYGLLDSSSQIHNDSNNTLIADTFDISKAMKSLPQAHSNTSGVLESIFEDSRKLTLRLESLESDLDSAARLLVNL
ncbi:Tip elongation aberrant protein Tea4 [Zancudomyces culisetae]|uniref:Tip elongation aberrant protein Tea4 n=1 Tax=Zancudomyces culisetae TaxID=1213189 RepID=A0A1R1PW48_ZANCU|nr:Tip elongation aberrant protein Tea4 [Zancudomyces culisetae]|eukprot:OMH85181.1 Tip elongation aberrant protein Tea4 [Zancudomyces culisetae]